MVVHLGDPSLNVGTIMLNSTIPHLSEEGYAAAWSVSNIRVISRAGGNDTDVTALTDVVYQGATETSDGYVNVTLTNTDLGKFMVLGDVVLVTYEATSLINLASNFTFSLDTVLITQSGTPDYK